MSVVLGFAIVFAGLPAALAGWYACGPISRSRLSAFARHRGLELTEDNGNQVIRYLAVTRRWRCAGVAAGCLLGFGWGLPGHRYQLNLLALFAGWFLGALAAEFHLARYRPGPRRLASLTPRLPRRYLNPVVWALLPLAAVGNVLPGPIAVLYQFDNVHWAALVGWLALALATLAAVALVRQRVLTRAQPVAAPDVLAADDAIRARSLHVLTGSGFAVASLCALGQVAATLPALDFAAAGRLRGMLIFASVLVLVVGRFAATARGPVRRPAT